MVHIRSVPIGCGAIMQVRAQMMRQEVRVLLLLAAIHLRFSSDTATTSGA
jgi:hypothetical protein